VDEINPEDCVSMAKSIGPYWNIAEKYHACEWINVQSPAGPRRSMWEWNEKSAKS
jgi:hypothetical protein